MLHYPARNTIVNPAFDRINIIPTDIKSVRIIKLAGVYQSLLWDFGRCLF